MNYLLTFGICLNKNYMMHRSKIKLTKINKRIIQQEEFKHDDNVNDNDEKLTDLKHVINKFKVVMHDDDIIN